MDLTVVNIYEIVCNMLNQFYYIFLVYCLTQHRQGPTVTQHTSMVSSWGAILEAVSPLQRMCGCSVCLQTSHQKGPSNQQGEILQEGLAGSH